MIEPVPFRWTVRVLLGLAGVLTVLAVFSVWAERQALDTDEWVETSSELIADEEIEAALRDFLVDELFTNVDVQAELSRRLPDDLKPLAGAASGALRQAATEITDRALKSEQLQTAWAQANRTAHELLLAMLENEGEVVRTEGDRVILELRPLVAEIAEQVGVGGDVANRIPDDVAELEILRSDQIETAQGIARLIHGLAVVLSLAALACFALAVYLAKGRRQVTLLWVGTTLILAGIAVYALRHYTGHVIIDALAETEAARPPAETVWSIGTSLMTSIATTVVVFGFVFILASWIASPTPSASSVRRLLAPVLRERIVVVYAALGFAALLYLAFSAADGLRALVTVGILVTLGALGITALRRQTEAEFPDARGGEGLARVRAWARATIERRRAARETGAATVAPPAPSAEDLRLERLERLARLRESGILDDEELAAEKRRVLAGGADEGE